MNVNKEEEMKMRVGEDDVADFDDTSHGREEIHGVDKQRQQPIPENEQETITEAGIMEDTGGEDNGDDAGNDDDDNDSGDEEERYHLAAGSTHLTLRRPQRSPAQIEDELQVLHSMWEMASVFDFLYLFRKQLRLTSEFTASELERVLITSIGDSGLLADIHMDLMKGISPKNEILYSNWQIHLANKIKFHWRNLCDGTPCPFKPEKYLEAVSYAELSTPQRARALHFLCCIRADREDIQLRLMEAEREKTDEEIAEAEAAAEVARQKASRGTRSSRFGTVEDDVPEMGAFETLEMYRKEPAGFDSTGAAYYYFDHSETTGFRMYKEIPRDPALDNEDEEHQPTASDIEREAAERAAAESKMGKKRRERALRKMPLIKSQYAVRDHPKSGQWQLVASTLDELVSLGETLHQAEDSSAATLGQSILEDMVPQLREKAEAEERKRRAAERVRSRLGVGNNGSGNITDFMNGSSHVMVSSSGRSIRRARTHVNYAFTDYDDMLRSAIRRSQRGEDSSYPSEDGMVRRSGRRGGGVEADQHILSNEEAIAMGLRRGRSNTGRIPGSDSAQDMELDELALRRALRAGGGGADGSADERSTQNTTSQYQTEPSEPINNRSRGVSSRGRSRLAPKYAQDYVDSVDEDDINDADGKDRGSDGAYARVQRPAKRGVGRPPRAAKKIPKTDDSDAGHKQHRSAAAKNGLLAGQQAHDVEMIAAMQQRGIVEQQQAAYQQQQLFMQQLLHLQAQGMSLPASATFMQQAHANAATVNFFNQNSGSMHVPRNESNNHDQLDDPSWAGTVK